MILIVSLVVLLLTGAGAYGGWKLGHRFEGKMKGNSEKPSSEKASKSDPYAWTAKIGDDIQSLEETLSQLRRMGSDPEMRKSLLAGKDSDHKKVKQPRRKYFEDTPDSKTKAKPSTF